MAYLLIPSRNELKGIPQKLVQAFDANGVSELTDLEEFTGEEPEEEIIYGSEDE